MSISKSTDLELYDEDGNTLRVRVDHEPTSESPYAFTASGGQNMYFTDTNLREVITLLRQALAVRKAG